MAVSGVAGIGVVVQGQAGERAARRERAAAGEAWLDELGSAGIEQLPELGAGHLTASVRGLAAWPPQQILGVAIKHGGGRLEPDPSSR
ncbi:MAG: hypothetical protein KY434_10495 [Actinobacteria bacterium]|nr:hypothetical protein [Actinomycetota bacterium]